MSKEGPSQVQNSGLKKFGKMIIHFHSGHQVSLFSSLDISQWNKIMQQSILLIWSWEIKWPSFSFISSLIRFLNYIYSLILRLLLSATAWCGCKQPGPPKDQAKQNTDTWTIGKSTKSQNNYHLDWFSITHWNVSHIKYIELK